MTEDEAKTKWCPFARQIESFAEKTSYNRTTDGKGVGNCLGSACMAWQAIIVHDYKTLKVGLEPEPSAKEKGWEAPITGSLGVVVWTRARNIGGYCGLAG